MLLKLIEESYNFHVNKKLQEAMEMNKPNPDRRDERGRRYGNEKLNPNKENEEEGGSVLGALAAPAAIGGLWLLRHPILDHFKHQQAQNNYNAENTPEKLQQTTVSPHTYTTKEILDKLPVKLKPHVNMDDDDVLSKLNDLH